ncbi:MAG: DUF2264 domain-containing protein [Anaerolineae bacterium]|nr:DUF2264 domain-containing protein [Anaerolineae bacterium]
MLPPLDLALSPYTGWTRAHWEHVLARLTYGYVLAAEKQGTYARALYPDDRRDLPDAVDALESFARLGSMWGVWLSNPKNPAALEFGGRELDIEEILRRALLEGTDASNPRTYWGPMRAMDQRIVESADTALAVWFSRDRVFNRMSESERAQVMTWLAQVDGQDTYYDNWILFPAVAQAVRLQLGYPVDVTELDQRLDQMATFYRGDGWYVDGLGAEYELYNAWMFGWHYVLWAHIDGARRPELRDLVLKRARSFLNSFPYFFGSNGSYPAWGRSIVYRFAAVACFGTGHLMNIAPMPPGGLRRLSSGCIKYFYDRDCIDPDGHFLCQGFHGDFPPAAEAYISPGSTSWACHGLFGLAFSPDDPFWTATEEPLPVERADFEVALPTPGFVLCGRRETGQVFLLNAGSGHQPENPRHNYIPKYGKLVYSTHFPFNVLPAGHTYAPDAMIALTSDDREFGHRFANRVFGVGPGVMWTEFVEYVDGEPQLLRTAIVMWRDVQLRFSWVQPTRRARAVEAPGALGSSGAAAVTRRSNRAQGWEYAQIKGRALAIKRLVGFDDQSPSAPFLDYANINLAYPYAEQPLVREANMSARIRSFAAAVLLRPGEFDPGQEFEAIHVTPQPNGAFEIRLPKDEIAYVSLADRPPPLIQVGNTIVYGDAIRYVRLAPGRVVGMGVTEIANVCTLEQPGTFELVRESADIVRVTTSAGIQVFESWLGGSASRVLAQQLDNSWMDVSALVRDNTISTALVREMIECNERKLVDFRLTR